MNARMKTLSGVMLKALTAAQQDVLIELWEVDFRPFGGEVWRFCNQINEKNGGIVWKGAEYAPYPIEAEGFEMTAQGAGNRPNRRGRAVQPTGRRGSRPPSDLRQVS